MSNNYAPVIRVESDAPEGYDPESAGSCRSTGEAEDGTYMVCNLDQNDGHTEHWDDIDHIAWHYATEVTN